MSKKLRAFAAFLMTALLVPAFAVTAFAEDTAAAAEKTFVLSEWMPLFIFVALIIVVFIVFFIVPKNREKTFKMFRGLKSECRKISWFSWKSTSKGSVVVVVSVIALAIVIGLLDVLFMRGITALPGLFNV